MTNDNIPARLAALKTTPTPELKTQWRELFDREPPPFKLVLGPIQAVVVKRLHQAVLTDDPWCSGKAVLAEAGATSRRMSDIFKSQPRWRELIESDGRGLYRLQLKIR